MNNNELELQLMVKQAEEEFNEIKDLDTRDLIELDLDNSRDIEDNIEGDYKSLYVRFEKQDNNKYKISTHINIYDEDVNIMWNDELENIKKEVEL